MNETATAQQSILSQVGAALTSQGISVDKLKFCSSNYVAGIINEASLGYIAEPDFTEEQPVIYMLKGETKRARFDTRRLERCITEFLQTQNVQEGE